MNFNPLIRRHNNHGQVSWFTSSTTRHSSTRGRSDVVQKDVSEAGDAVFHDEQVTSLGIVADAAARCYHHLFYLLNYYLVDYYNVFVTVDIWKVHQPIHRLRQLRCCDDHLCGRSEAVENLLHLVVLAFYSDASGRRRRSQ